MTHCHLLWLIVTYYNSLSLIMTRCRSLSLVVARCHSLSLIVARCHLLSIVVARCHSLSLVVCFSITRLVPVITQPIKNKNSLRSVQVDFDVLSKTRIQHSLADIFRMKAKKL